MPLGSLGFTSWTSFGRHHGYRIKVRGRALTPGPAAIRRKARNKAARRAAAR